MFILKSKHDRIVSELKEDTDSYWDTIQALRNAHKRGQEKYDALENEFVENIANMDNRIVALQSVNARQFNQIRLLQTMIDNQAAQLKKPRDAKGRFISKD